MKKIAIPMIFALLALMMCGCMTTQVEVPVVRPWEGRYESKKSVQSAIETMQLERGESAWLLSNSTLKRLLKTMKE